jgi:hypothetical protein
MHIFHPEELAACLLMILIAVDAVRRLARHQDARESNGLCDVNIFQTLKVGGLRLAAISATQRFSLLTRGEEGLSERMSAKTQIAVACSAAMLCSIDAMHSGQSYPGKHALLAIWAICFIPYVIFPLVPLLSHRRPDVQ